MSNKIRPRCPNCKTAMTPLSVRRKRADTMIPVNAYECREHGTLARRTESGKAFRMLLSDGRDITVTIRQ